MLIFNDFLMKFWKFFVIILMSTLIIMLFYAFWYDSRTGAPVKQSWSNLKDMNGKSGSWRSLSIDKRQVKLAWSSNRKRDSLTLRRRRELRKRMSSHSYSVAIYQAIWSSPDGVTRDQIDHCWIDRLRFGSVTVNLRRGRQFADNKPKEHPNREP